MNILEVSNPVEVRHMFETIPAGQRVMPSIIMAFVTSKGILLFVVNVLLMSIAISTVWVDKKNSAREKKFQQQRNTIVVSPRNYALSPD